MKVMSILAVAMLAAVPVFAEKTNAEKSEEFSATCVVADKPAKQGKSADYKGGKVYFCCGGCSGKFAKNPEKFATRANAQLVSTGQAEQIACPITGGKINPDKKAEVAGVAVNFCCGNCEGKVKSADEKTAMTLVFSEKAFGKGFEVKSDK